MKLVKFTTTSEENTHTGILSDGVVHDLRDTSLIEGSRSPLANTIEVLGQKGLEPFKKVDAPTYEADDVSLKAPVPEDARVICLGGVYAQHLRERNDPLNQVPSQWIAPDNAVIGQNDSILLSEKVKEKTMPAVELGVVIGTDCRYISEEEVSDVVAGYTVCNDITAQTDWPAPMAYKLMDTFLPTGPEITPASHVPNPSDLNMKLEKDGEVICSGTTSSMRFTIPFVISHVSTIIGLRPGDIISTGDPGNVDSNIEPGSRIEATIEEVGRLSNPVVGTQ